MTALVLDAAALVAVDAGDRAMIARLRAALDAGLELRTHPLVVAQAWRDPRGRQANLARLLRAVDVVPIDERFGRQCGELLGAAGTSDPIDAAVVLLARDGDRIATGDLDDLARLAAAAARKVLLVAV